VCSASLQLFFHLRILKDSVEPIFISFGAQYEMKMLNNDRLLSFPRRRESRKWHLGNWIPAPCLRRDKLRRNDRYGAFSFPHSLSSLMVSGFSLTYRNLSSILHLTTARSGTAKFLTAEARRSQRGCRKSSTLGGCCSSTLTDIAQSGKLYRQQFQTAR
jgi:hypothetical protein